MSHFAFIGVPTSGHLAPMVAIAHELVRRGHEATFFHHPDVERLVAASNLDFVPLGGSGVAAGRLDAAIERAGRVRGFVGVGPVIRDLAAGTAMFCEKLPAALRAHGVDLIVGDAIEPACGLVAHHLGLPHVSVAGALPLNWAPGDVSPFVGWSYHGGCGARYANMAAQWVAERLQGRIRDVVLAYARAWNLPANRRVQDWASGFAQITQLTPSLDFPRRSLIGCFHYCGPLRSCPTYAATAGASRTNRRRAFASLGSLQGHRADVFERIADAAEMLDLDLTIAHGGRLAPAAVARLSRRATVHEFVDYAGILTESDVAIMHGGMNGVLDALTHGVPLVLSPLAYEQGAIAARVTRAGAGVACRPRAPGKHIAAAIAMVLGHPSYVHRASTLRREIAAAGGAGRAADIVEQVARTGRPCINAATVAVDRTLAGYALGAA